MAEHERYEEMCALAAGGHLTGPEYLDFQAHIQECPGCSILYRDFSAIVDCELPQVEGVVRRTIAALKTKSSPDSRQRFLRRARAEGIALTPDVDAQRAGKWLHVRPATVLATAVALVALTAGLTVFYFRSARDISRTQDPSMSERQIAELVALKSQLEANLAERQNVIDSQQQELGTLRSEVEAQTQKIAETSRQLEQAQRASQSLAATQAALNDSRTRLADLQVQIQAKERTLTDANAEASRLRSLQGQAEASLVAQQTRVSDLSEQLRVQKATLDMQRELMAAGREVRNIMGARQLHIVDVHDTDARGKEQRAFGRIFLTEGKQLVFYAFDLNEAKVKNAKHTFQVWGQQEGKKTSAHSLGFLIVDDKTQKRWALKVDDPNLLKEIDAVFVTVEPAVGGGKQPSGEKMLYAYLGEANHP